MFRGHYDGWTQSRINCIKKYIDPEFFKNKTMFEVGCGNGIIGNLFYDMGCDVTSTDVRQEHITTTKSKYPNLKTAIFDCNTDALVTKYDIILHWGTLYHLENIERHMSNILQFCDYIFLESEIIYSMDNDYITEYECGYDQSINNKGTIPSQSYVEKLLTKSNFNYEMIVDNILNYDFHKYDWVSDNSKKRIYGHRRFWICWKSNVNSPIKKLKNVAVCYHGLTRTFQKTCEINKKTIFDFLSKKYNVCVFLHTWHDVDGDIELEGQNVRDGLSIIGIHKTKYDYIVEKYDTNLFSHLDVNKYKKNIHCSVNIYNVFSQNYSRKCSRMLLEQYEISNNIRFDIIFSLRCDYGYMEPILHCYDIDNQSFLMVNPKENWLGGLSDQSCIGDRNSVIIFMSLYDNIDNLFNSGVCFHPETLMGKHIENKNINIWYFREEHLDKLKILR